jgi:hypothetical protein
VLERIYLALYIVAIAGFLAFGIRYTARQARNARKT